MRQSAALRSHDRVRSLTINHRSDVGEVAFSLLVQNQSTLATEPINTFILLPISLASSQANYKSLKDWVQSLTLTQDLSVTEAAKSECTFGYAACYIEPQSAEYLKNDPIDS